MAPPSDECENYVARLKAQSLPKKTLQTASKSAYKWQRNACSNYAPLERTALRTRSVTNKQTKQTRNKCIVPSRTMHTGRMSCHSTKKGVNYYNYMSIITMRSRRFTANSASDCLRFAKFRPQFSESCGATYTRLYEILQNCKAHLVL